MNTRKQAPVAPAAAPWNPFADATGLLDLPRQQAAVATHAACALFSGFEEMRRIQERPRMTP